MPHRRGSHQCALTRRSVDSYRKLAKTQTPGELITDRIVTLDSANDSTIFPVESPRSFPTVNPASPQAAVSNAATRACCSVGAQPASAKKQI